MISNQHNQHGKGDAWGIAKLFRYNGLTGLTKQIPKSIYKYQFVEKIVTIYTWMFFIQEDSAGSNVPSLNKLPTNQFIETLINKEEDEKPTKNQSNKGNHKTSVRKDSHKSYR